MKYVKWFLRRRVSGEVAVPVPVGHGEVSGSSVGRGLGWWRRNVQVCGCPFHLSQVKVSVYLIPCFYLSRFTVTNVKAVGAINFRFMKHQCRFVFLLCYEFRHVPVSVRKPYTHFRMPDSVWWPLGMCHLHKIHSKRII